MKIENKPTSRRLVNRNSLIVLGALIGLLLAVLAFPPPLVRGIYYDAMGSAVCNNKPITVRILLWLGASPDGSSEHHYSLEHGGGVEFTPHIYGATSHHDCTVLRLLMDAGADIHDTMADWSVIGSAVDAHNPEAIRLLLAAGATPYHTTSRTIADQAQRLGYDDLVPVLKHTSPMNVSAS